MIVESALPVLLECSLNVMALPGAMANVGFSGVLVFVDGVVTLDYWVQNPDIVQEFFNCMDRVSWLAYIVISGS